jgi:hypothetical protein
MRTRAALTAAVLLAASLGSADTDVRRNGDKVEVHASSAPLTEVLDRLARQTGMKVAYDGPQPRARVRVDLAGVTPLQAVMSILEGQGLNYALRMDPSGTRIETLLLVAGGASGAPAAVGPAPRPEIPPRMFEREREQPEPQEPEEVPAEAPARGNDENEGPKSPRDLMPPNIPAPTGPAAPLMLPTPPAPGAMPGMMTPGAPNGMPGFPPGVIPSPAPSTPQ